MALSTKKVRRYKHAAHAAWRRLEGEAIILDLNTSVYYSLNDTGALIWERLGAGDEPGSIADALCEEFSVNAESAERDIEQLVSHLLKESLLIPA
jgi:hypothetical protein